MLLIFMEKNLSLTYREKVQRKATKHLLKLNKLHKRRTKKGEPISELSLSVPGAGLEPARPVRVNRF